MTSRQRSKLLREYREKAHRRYQKERRANLLAAPGAHKLIMVLDHLKPDFNIGKIFRAADAFGVHEVHLVGTEYFDPTPAKGSFRWVPARFHADFGSCYQDLSQRGYTLFTLEPGADRMLPGVSLPERSAFVMGHEEFGISFDKTDFPGVRALGIPQFGKVQSLNVSIAAGVVMYEYVRQRIAQTGD